MEKVSADMDDVALAKDLIVRIAGALWGGKADMMERAFSAVSKQYPNWTRRRIRAICNGEAAHVRFHEVAELADIANSVQELANARKEHAAYVAKTANIARVLQLQDEDFHRPSIEGLGRIAR